MISKKIESAINDQILLEELSSRVYLAMASWCEVQGLQGVANFLYKHSDEERMDQLKLIRYLNDREGYAELQALPKPEIKCKDIEELFTQVLKHEQLVSKKINDLVDMSLEEKDHATFNFLQWFVSEQVEEESLVNNILAKIKLAGDSKMGKFHIDNFLASLDD